MSIRPASCKVLRGNLKPPIVPRFDVDEGEMRRLPMRKIKDVLRLHAAGRSARQIGPSVGVNRSTVADYLRRAEVADKSMAARLGKHNESECGIESIQPAAKQAWRFGLPCLRQRLLEKRAGRVGAS